MQGDNPKVQQNSQSNCVISQSQEWRTQQNNNMTSGVMEPQAFAQQPSSENTLSKEQVNKEFPYKDTCELERQYRSVRQIRVGKSNRIANGDGYTWRKYGEKSVRGSKFPRHYYKCNLPECSAKKICAFDSLGQCLYLDIKGSHNHPPLQDIKSYQNGQQSYCLDQGQDCNKAQNQLRLSNVYRNVKNHPNNSLPRFAKQTDISDQLKYTYDQGQGACGGITSPVKHDPGPFKDPVNFQNMSHNDVMIFNSFNDQECHETGIYPHEYNQMQAQQEYADYSNSNFQNSNFQHFKQTQFVANAIINVDNQRILQQYNSNGKQMIIVEAPMDQNSFNDGYRYRKYGCKSVKDNLFPRNYYRCIESGCNVRRLIERWPKDVQYLMITYEGIHNHNHTLANDQNQMQKKRKLSGDEFSMLNFDIFQ